VAVLELFALAFSSATRVTG
jgi:hypothetical protein